MDQVAPLIQAADSDIGPNGESEQYSGARVARMILHSRGAGPSTVIDGGTLGTPGSAAPPTALYNHAHAYDDSGEGWPFWYIDPGAMDRTLNDYDPDGPMFVTYSNATHAAADSQLASTLLNYQVAAAVLVYGGKHWVCVTGYTGPTPTAYDGFYYTDPTYGSMANAWAATADWDAAYTPVGGGVKWLNKIVEVGDPRPIKEPARAAPRTIVRSGETIIPSEEVGRIAVEGALAQCPGVPHLREAIAAGHPGQPQLVARLDREDSYYYLVPIEVEAKSETEGRPAVLALIRLDARFGDVLGATASETAFRPWPVQQDDVRELVTRQPIPVHEPLGLAGGRLLDAILRSGCGSASIQSAPLSLRETVMGALASYAQPRDFVVLRPHEFEIDPIWYWGPCGGVSQFHPYHRVRTPWRCDIYVNAGSGLIRAGFELCLWTPLGG